VSETTLSRTGAKRASLFCDKAEKQCETKNKLIWRYIMPGICLYFQIHQPYRLRHYTFFDIGNSPFYEDADLNRTIIRKAEERCYLPMNELLLKLVKKHKGKLKLAFSISGMALDQWEHYTPEALASFKKLVDTGAVELLAETYSHTLAFSYSKEEYIRQIKLHSDKIYELFGVRPKVFRNTALIYNNELGQLAEEMGFKAVLAEGADHVLGWRSSNYVYSAEGLPGLRLLLRSYRLSDDISTRFSQQSWTEYPLTADKYMSWMNSVSDGELINLFMDYETFGDHHRRETGIFEFMEAFIDSAIKDKNFDFVTPSEAVEKYSPAGELDVPEFVSWTDIERDLTPWMGNDMQKDALESLYRMEDEVLSSGSDALIQVWRKMQSSDHFYFMSTKWFVDGSIHKYFNPYNTPYDAYINFMNILSDFGLRLEANGKSSVSPKKSVTKKTKSATQEEAPATKKTPAKKAAKPAEKAKAATAKPVAKATKAKAAPKATAKPKAEPKTKTETKAKAAKPSGAKSKTKADL
jgi:alpha-amylase